MQPTNDAINKVTQKMSYFDPSDSFKSNLKGNPACLLFNIYIVKEAMVNYIEPVRTDPNYTKALPSKIDYKKLSPYFAFKSHEVIQHTLQQTTQLTKSTIHYPMRCHLKSQFQMLSHKRLNEVIATDTYFSSERSIEGYHCAQAFFGMTSKILIVSGMKTESEFPDVYLDFIRQHGISSALRRDNAKSEMSQLVCQIHWHLVIADQ
jgi:hypothetical protein